MDFVRVTLGGGRRVRVLAVLGVHTRESPAIRAAHRFSAERVAAAPDEVAAERGVPTRDLWA